MISFDEARIRLLEIAKHYVPLQIGTVSRTSRAAKTIMAWSRRLMALARYAEKGVLSLDQLYMDTVTVWARLEEAVRLLPNGPPDTPGWVAKKVINEMRLDLLNWLVFCGEKRVVPQEVLHIIEEERDVSEFVGGGPWSQWAETRQDRPAGHQAPAEGSGAASADHPDQGRSA
jgi:hypothetical protein